MKRYDLTEWVRRGNFDLVMSEHSRGKWVKFEDVNGDLKDLDDIEERITHLERTRHLLL